MAFESSNDPFKYYKGNISSTQTIEKQYSNIEKAKVYALSLSDCIGFCIESDKQPRTSKEYLIHFKSGNANIQEYGQWHTFLTANTPSTPQFSVSVSQKRLRQNIASKPNNIQKQFCQSAISDVCSKISIKFPHYPQFAELFSAQCIEEAFEEIDLLIEYVSEGFDNSVILEEIAEKMEFEEKDKEALCSSIHYILSTFCPPPTTLNLGIIAFV